MTLISKDKTSFYEQIRNMEVKKVTKYSCTDTKHVYSRILCEVKGQYRIGINAFRVILDSIYFAVKTNFFVSVASFPLK